MKIRLIQIGSTHSKEISCLLNEYNNRLNHYVNFEIVTIPELKNTAGQTFEAIRKKEWELILSKSSNYTMVLLDEQGTQFSSREFATLIQKKQLHSTKVLCFVIGGAFGFPEEVKKMKYEKISLSKMTFSHQMMRLIFTEQLYRAFTIIKGEKYHHD